MVLTGAKAVFNALNTWNVNYFEKLSYLATSLL